MRLYHYTSIDNLEKIISSGSIIPVSLHEDKNVVWLTRDVNRHHQHWARGTDKADVRITLSIIEFEKFILPDSGALRHDLFRLGADNWYFSIKEKPLISCLKVDIFDKALGRYKRYCDVVTRKPGAEKSYWYRVKWGKEKKIKNK